MPVEMGFALEYSLGHITHAQNLKGFLASDADVAPTYVDIPFDKTPMPPALRPVFKDNWSVRASVAARRGLSAKSKTLQACLFHTQVTSLFSPELMRRVPSVVSLDATPLQYDSLGSFYKHRPGPAPLERLKKRLNEGAFHGAKHLVTWSQWAKDSLVADYGIAPEKVSVIPPGIDLDLWRSPAPRTERADGSVHLLFVGGDFERKGGTTLLEAFRMAKASNPRLRLHIVTKTLDPDFHDDGIDIYRDMAPNSEALRALYAQADAFVFPTLGDCLPLAVMEALAAGLPVITSHVGALAEAVTDGLNGLVVAPGDAGALASAIAALADDSTSRKMMSLAAIERAEERFDASKNYRRLIDILKGLAA
jgi:glycosyltransferase involved in cell wall biosynthesis